MIKHKNRGTHGHKLQMVVLNVARVSSAIWHTPVEVSILLLACKQSKDRDNYLVRTTQEKQNKRTNKQAETNNFAQNKTKKTKKKVKISVYVRYCYRYIGGSAAQG